MNKAALHLWQGEWIDDAELESRLDRLGRELSGGFPEPLRVSAVLAACERLGGKLGSAMDDDRRELLACLRDAGRMEGQEASATVDELAAFLSRANLEEKLSRELASGRLEGADPFRLERIDYRKDIFEAWAPIGFLVHVAPTNAANVPFLSVIEGLLAGNVNFLKTAGDDSAYPLLCLKALLDCDASGTIAQFVYAARVSSRRQDLLKRIVAQADGIAAWGGEEAVAGIRAIAPPQARVIEWGHKISLAYVAADSVDVAESVLEGLARECCLMEQQACSSPQVIYVETGDLTALKSFAARFASVLERVSAGTPRIAPSLHERAEITRVVEIAKLEGSLPEASSFAGQVIEASDGSWRVLVDPREGLRASPLYRTVWIKPLPRARLMAALRPLRHYLQTVGLICGSASLGELSSLFFRAGALRILPAGSMLSGYLGEPHDGVYALQRYSRRVSVVAPEAARGLTSIDSGSAGPSAVAASSWGRGPVMTKEAFGSEAVEDRYAELFFKSGGSSGEPKLSVFTYDDYHAQMRAAAQGLYAAGLDPREDRCANLFFGGGLYGGFLSFFTILEYLKAVQLPMMAHSDLEFVGKMIVEKRANVVLGMPSYLAGLFKANHERFKQYRGIRKIFYGGEHLSGSQREYYRSEYGVELIRSAAYGSNDIGPMGYQCSVGCEGSVHHLQDGLHDLEILDPSADRPVEPGQAGRLVFSSRVRKGQKLARYDLGDLGRWVPGRCECGRASPRFELLGRQGDIFRCGGTFLNYNKLARLLAELPGFGGGEMQLEVLAPSGASLGCEVLRLFYAGTPVDSEEVRKACLHGCKDLREVVFEDQTVQFEVHSVPGKALERVPTSGKLRRILDRRPDAS